MKQSTGLFQNSPLCGALLRIRISPSAEGDKVAMCLAYKTSPLDPCKPL
ncbi:MAG: hypothetical protein ACI4RG_08495 [Huintestinicola sp.]